VSATEPTATVSAPRRARAWSALTAIGAVLIAVIILGVLQLKYSPPQELH
tara:strand:+ start:101307 stop:101456 length:150 start_codon:yes stop_codon:yes gene_type:complete